MASKTLFAWLTNDDDSGRAVMVLIFMGLAMDMVSALEPALRIQMFSAASNGIGSLCQG